MRRWSVFAVRLPSVLRVRRGAALPQHHRRTTSPERGRHVPVPMCDSRESEARDTGCEAGWEAAMSVITMLSLSG